MVRSPIAARTGALFTSLTTTLKDLVSLRGGEPSSVTRTVIVLVLGPCASPGVQLMAPLVGLIVMPPGGASRLKVNVLVGRSESEAEAETARVANSLIV